MQKERDVRTETIDTASEITKSEILSFVERKKGAKGRKRKVGNDTPLLCVEAQAAGNEFHRIAS